MLRCKQRIETEDLGKVDLGFMKEGRIIVRDYIKGKITYSEGVKRIFELGLDKKEKLKWFNNIRSIRDEFIEGDFYPANLHLGILKSW